MGYGVELTPTAERAIDALPGMVAHVILGELERLAEDPVSLGRPSHFPFLLGRQMYQFMVETDGRWWVTVFFRFSVDEKNIIILDLAVIDAA